MFVAAAAQQERRRMSAAMIAARVAQASAEDFRTALRELDS